MKMTSARRLGAAVAVALVMAACTVGGTATIAPYRSRPPAGLVATTITAPIPAVLALSPNGTQVAIADPVHGACLRSIEVGATATCARLILSGRLPISAAFSPDGRLVAVGQDVTAQGDGRVWLVDTVTGQAQVVPPVDRSASGGGTASSTAVAAGGGSQWVGMVWNAATGHLLLLSHAIAADGARTRLIDVDPASLIPRVVAQATGPYEFQSGYLAANGSTVIFTVYQDGQLPPNLVVVDLNTGRRREFGPLGAGGTQLVPLAVSPLGRLAIVGSATLGHSGPPRLLDLATGQLTDIAAATGDFVMAGFSPNGAQLALVTVTGTTAGIAIAPVGGAARTLLRVPARFAAGSRLSWSGTDRLSVYNPTPVAAGAVLGWALAD